MILEPYLFFNGRCREALDFYQQAIGAEITVLMQYKDAPDKEMIPPGCDDKVMHANVQIGEHTLMVSDGQCSGDLNFQGFSLSLSLKDTTEAERLFTALADGGEVTMPLGKTFWSPAFGMVTDRFGVDWMINVLGECA